MTGATSLPFLGRDRPRQRPGWGSEGQTPGSQLDPHFPALPGFAGLSLPMKGREG